jgi:hypothetical protein
VGAGCAAPRWVSSGRTRDDEYEELWAGKTKGPGHAVDLYFADPVDPASPLVVFQHIRKTGGTSLRHLIHSNRGASSYEILFAPTDPSRLGDWYRTAYDSLGSRPDHLVCAAGHSANYLIPFVDRPVVALTIVRDPIEWAVSRYSFFGKERSWSLEDLYGISGHQPAKKLRKFSNAQATSLLAPHHDTTTLPTLSDHADAEHWRRRLFELVDRVYLVGLQERFLQSVELFAQRLGWSTLYPASTRINWVRTRESIDADLAEAIRRYNWLDEELYRRTLDWFEREGPDWEG